MKLSSYLSASRHGIYYFRWPLPSPNGLRRSTIRISLKTHCPNRAGDLARYLASYGRIIRDNKKLTKLRQDQMRDMVRTYFKAALDRYVDRLNDTGLPEQTLLGIQQELEIHEDAMGGSTEISDLVFDSGMVSGFRRYSNLSDAQWLENEADLRREMRKARRDQIRASLSASQSLNQYSFSEASNPPQEPPQESSAPLGQAIQDFMQENSRQWPDKTTKQFQAYLNVLIEYFGSDRVLGSITKRDASDVKKVLQSLPVSRNTKPALKGLPLSEVVKVTGHKTISPKTINSHIGTFHRFFDWAERHGHAPHRLFEGMKVPKAKDAATDRRPFTTEQTHLIYAELTENTSGFVKKDSHKWGALLGLYTGARLNEVCQLEIADIQEQDDTWFLNITDVGDAKKSVKAQASRRKVPLHSKLMELGFLEFVKTRGNGRRLFPDYSFNTNGGYGRSLGRWFNESFLPKLEIKEPSLVFHSLRHTMVTRLGQAGVAEPIIQCIVGHARIGVTQEVYLKEGYKLEQLSDAIESFSL